MFQISLDQFSTFIFDFDGVIVDSLDVKTRAFGELFKGHGPAVSEQVMNYHRNNGGVSRYEKFRYFYKNFLELPVTDEIIDDLDRRYSQLVVEEVVAAPFVEGAKELLDSIQSAGKKCFVISGTPQNELRGIVNRRQLEGYFLDVLGSPKNKKENLEYLMKKHHFVPQDAIYFGDARADYEAARHNRIQFVAIVDKSTELEDVLNITKIKNFKNIFSVNGYVV